VKGHGSVDWSPEDLARIEEIISRYPEKRAAMLPLLWLAQEKWGWLSADVIRRVAKTMGVPPSDVFGVATFYTMFKKAPTGKYLVQVCHTLPCALRGADAIVEHLQKTLQVDEHGQSADGLFTLERVECLASCGSAPMMQINEHFYELLTPQRCDQVIEAMRAGAPLPTPRPEASEWTWNPAS
jgi:NADH-quinone oxidoreductase subunit E